MRTLAILLMLVSTAAADNCRVVRNQNIVIQDTGLAIVPFAIATPVATVVPGTPMYSYQATAQAYQPRATAQSDEQALYREFLEWRANRVQVRAVPAEPNGTVRFDESNKETPEQAIENAKRIGKIAASEHENYEKWIASKAATIKAQAAPVSLFASNCLKCHSQGGTGFAHHDFSKPLTSDNKLAAIDAIVQGAMPPKRPLDPQVRADIVAELSKREKQVKAAVVPQVEKKD